MSIIRENFFVITEFLPDNAETYTHTIKDLESDLDLCVRLKYIDKDYPVLPVIKGLQILVNVTNPEFILTENSKLNLTFKN